MNDHHIQNPAYSQLKFIIESEFPSFSFDEFPVSENVRQAFGVESVMLMQGETFISARTAGIGGVFS